MKKRSLLNAALLASAGLAAASGCSKSTPTPAPSTAITPPTTQPVAAKEMTHVLSKDEPYFEAMPTAAAKPAGMLSGGTKVLLVIPGYPYCQVETASGTQVYTMTDGVDFIAAPAPPKPKKVAAPATKPVAMVVPKGKEMTHTLTKAQPYFVDMPVGDAKPAGTLPSGAKVLLLIPGTPYCQVETVDGMTVYTMIDGVESIAKK